MIFMIYDLLVSSLHNHITSTHPINVPDSVKCTPKWGYYIAVVHTFIYHIPGQVGHTVCDSLHFHSPKLKQLLCKTFFSTTVYVFLNSQIGYLFIFRHLFKNLSLREQWWLIGKGAVVAHWLIAVVAHW